MVLCELRLNPLRGWGVTLGLFGWACAAGTLKPLASTRPTIMDKSLGTLLRFWGKFQFTQVQPLPSPHKQCCTRVHSEFFPFNFVQGGGSENCKTIPKRMHCFKREPRNDRKIGILQYSPKDKLHVYKLFFTGNVSNAIRF